jgi:hypothetical protein
VWPDLLSAFFTRVFKSIFFETFNNKKCDTAFTSWQILHREPLTFFLSHAYRMLSRCNAHDLSVIYGARTPVASVRVLSVCWIPFSNALSQNNCGKWSLERSYLSFCPLACKRATFYQTVFREISCLTFWLKLNRNNRHFTWRSV